jgi:hypothetical protein
VCVRAHVCVGVCARARMYVCVVRPKDADLPDAQFDIPPSLSSRLRTNEWVGCDVKRHLTTRTALTLTDLLSWLQALT